MPRKSASGRARGKPLRLAGWVGQAERAVGRSVLTGQHPQHRRRRCRWHAGPDCPPGTVVSHGGPGISMRGGFLHVPQRDPSVQRRGDERVPQRVRPDRLGDPARPATRRPIRPAPCRSSRRPSAARKIGPSERWPTARSIARAVRGASGIVTTLPPLRVITNVRCPRSTPRASIFAPVASETRSPFRASSEISACSAGAPSPAATSSAPSSLRSSPVACDS